MTRTRTNNITNVSTTRTGDYFVEIDSQTAKSVTYLRHWDNINLSANYLMMKTSYSTEYLEAMIKVGPANTKISRRESAVATHFPFNGSAVSVESAQYDSSIVDLPQGFAYEFRVRGEPYSTEDFSVVTEAFFNSLTNKGNGFTTSSVIKSTETEPVLMSRTFTQGHIEYEQFGYGIGVSVAMKLGTMHPYMGLGYTDGKTKVSQMSTRLDEAYTGGVLTTGISTSEKLEYILTPKTKISLRVGFSIPFEKGGMNVEGKLGGENSLALSGFIGF